MSKISLPVNDDGGTGAAPARPRALVVDDAPDVAEMVAQQLRLSGYEALTAPSPGRALELASTQRFDVVVCDIAMPGMDGYELVRRLRGLPRYGRVPMLSVSGFASYADRGRSLDAGFDEHLPKPIDPDTLVATVDRLLGSEVTHGPRRVGPPTR